MEVPDFGRAEYVASSVSADEVTIAEPPPIPDKMAFVRAIGYGAFFGLLGSVIYAVVGIWIEIGFVAILVGAMVGTGMMSGSGGVGGRRYQVAALVLTYFSVTFAFVLEVLWYEGRKGTAVAAYIANHFVFLIAVLLFGPLLRLTGSLGGGLIGLLILFFGMQAAWRIARGGPGFLKFRRYDPHKPLGLR